MSLKGRLLLTAGGSGAAMVAYALWGWLPGDAAPPARYAFGAVVTAGLATMMVLSWLAIQAAVRRPLVAGGGEARGPEGIEGVVERLSSLETRLAQRDAELRQAMRLQEEAQCALRVAEERYALAVRSASDGLWEWNLESGVMYLSPRWMSMLGFSEKDIPHTLDGWRERVHPEDLADAEAELREHLSGATPRYEHQHRLIHRDGAIRWVLSRGAAIRRASGKAYRVVGLDTDVTSIRRVETVLNEIVEGTSGTWGDSLFRSLVRHFAAAMQVPRAFVTECCNQPPTRVRTLAHWQDGGFADNFEYDLRNTPCEGVMAGRTCFFPEGLGVLFPRERGWEAYLGVPIFGATGMVIGHLVFLDRRPMPGDMLMDALFRVFAARAAAELERRHALEQLERLSAVPVALG